MRCSNFLPPQSIRLCQIQWKQNRKTSESLTNQWEESMDCTRKPMLTLEVDAWSRSRLTIRHVPCILYSMGVTNLQMTSNSNMFTALGIQRLRSLMIWSFSSHKLLRLILTQMDAGTWVGLMKIYLKVTHGNLLQSITKWWSLWCRVSKGFITNLSDLSITILINIYQTKPNPWGLRHSTS